MIRNLKALGVTLAAIFALGAVVASAASAQQAYLTGDGPLKELTGKTIGALPANRITTLGSYITCHTVDYTVTKEGGGNFEHATTLTVQPTYENCTFSALSFTAHLNMNGCDYVLHLQETTGTPADTYGVLTTLSCPGPNKPVITVTGIGGNCAITITPNPAGYPGLDILDNTNGDITLKGTATGLVVDAAGAGCPATGQNPATVDAEITITGDNSLGEPTSIGISEQGETTNTP